MSGLKEVAARAGVSVSTASRVLTGEGYASASAREAVLRAANDLNYVPNDVARSLRAQRTRTLGLIISDIENSFYASMAKTMEAVALASGYRVVVANSDDDPEQEWRLVRAFHKMRVDGLLITPSGHNLDELRQVNDAGVPIVQIDRYVAGLNCVSILLDNEGAMKVAINYLISYGHSSIAVIAGPQTQTTGFERAKGALSAATAALRDTGEVHVYASSFKRAEAMKAVQLALRENPSAILAGNNVIAEACMEACWEHGITIPGDISIIAFDDALWMRWVSCPLTAIRQPVIEMTEAATASLLGLLGGEGVEIPPSRRFQAELIVRESVCRAAPR